MLHLNEQKTAKVLVAAPKILQGFVAATTDFFTLLLAAVVYGSHSAEHLVALLLTVFSPWQWFCSTRTLSNSLETTLTVVALTLWPWNWFLRPGAPQPFCNSDEGAEGKAHTRDSDSTDTLMPGRLYPSLCTAAIACILRPTNLLVWATLSIAVVVRYTSFPRAMALLQSAATCGGAVLAVSVSMDRSFYGRWVLPPVRFLQFNVVQSLAVFYGTNRPDYYLTEGLPLLLTTALPFAVAGMWTALQPDREIKNLPGWEKAQIRFLLALSVIVPIVVLSLISHKEVRFIYPLLPILHVLSAKTIAASFKYFPFVAKRRYFAVVLWLCLALNICIAYYTGHVHQRGVIDVMHYLRNAPGASAGTISGISHTSVNKTVGFLMPCHSTPWRSHLIHSSTHAWALTCEPPLGLTMLERKDYLDEADVFYADPASWITNNMRDPTSAGKTTDRNFVGEADERRSWPHYLVFFEQLELVMKDVLRDSVYRECWKGFNTHWHDDWRRQGDVVVWCTT